MHWSGSTEIYCEGVGVCVCVFLCPCVFVLCFFR